MKLRSSSAALLLLLCTLAVFIWHTSADLPDVVASHFGSSGAANGFMPREIYISLMLGFVVVVPLILVFLPAAAAGADGKKLNIPNREYWLAPERRENTLMFIRWHSQWFAAAVAIFLAYVHWLVVQANERQPPQLSNSDIIAGLVVFFLLLAVWLFVLFARFRKHA